MKPFIHLKRASILAMFELRRNTMRNDFRSAVFGTIHECGHALYDQNIDIALEGLPIAQGTSMGIHESQSLFYEQFIGHNESFWTYNFDLLKSQSPEQFEGVSLEDFFVQSM